MIQINQLDVADDAASQLLEFRAAASLDEAFAARNALVERHLPLVPRAVTAVLRNNFPGHRKDAAQEACCALIELAARIGAGRIGHFEAYAMAAMMNRIRGYLARNLTRIRRHLIDHGTVPEESSDRQLATATGLSRLAIRRMRPWIRAPLGLSAGPENSAHGHIAEPAHERDPIEELSLADDAARLHALVARLPPLDRFVVTRLVGLDGEVPLSVSELAGVMGCSPQRVWFRWHRALRRLRAMW